MGSRQFIVGVVNQKQTPIVPEPVVILSGFTTEWQTTAPSESITLPLTNNGTFNATVSWGDGSPDSTITTYNSANRIHTYTTAGTYRVNIRGECPGWAFNGGGDRLKIKKVLHWGEVGQFGGFQYIAGGFQGCSNLTTLPSGTGNKILTKPSLLNNIQSIFYNCTSLTVVPSGIFDNVKQLVSSGGYYFYNCSALQTIPSGLFNSITGGSNISLDYAFYGCTLLQTIPSGLLDVFSTRLIGGTSCFRGCTTITSIPAGLFKYNSNITNMQYAFDGCNHITAIPAGLFSGSSKITAFTYAFRNCSLITSSIPSGLFANNKIQVNSNGATSIFEGCSNLSGAIPAGLFDKWSGMTTAGFYGTFKGCSSLTSIPAGLFDKQTLLTGTAGANGFYETFANCTSLTSIPTDLFKYNTLVGGASDTSYNCFKSTFQGCTSISTIPNDLFKYNTDVRGFISTFDYNKLSSIPAGLFSGNTKVVRFYRTLQGSAGVGSYTSIPATLFAKNYKVTSFDSVFQYTRITSVPTGLFDAFTGCTTYNSNFLQCIYLTTGVTAGLYDKSTLATSITSEFSQCSNLQSIPAGLFKYNTLVTNFSSMFNYCYQLTTVPVGLFSANTLCTNFNQTFLWCKKLELNRYIFDATDASGSTRFLNQSVNFGSCFWFYSADLPYTGVQGTAPQLWNYNFGFGTPTKTGCFTNRDNVACLSNYLDIPAAWK